jgi:hypothetical protein
MKCNCNVTSTFNCAVKSGNLDPHCTKMNKSTVVGYLGEIVVREKLISEGLTVEHFGNQTGFDLKIENGPRIDVKACTRRSDFGTDADFWGWALLSESKKRKINFTHIICVAFTTALDVHKFYVIHTDNLSKFPKSSPRFKGVLRCYNVFDRVPPLLKKSQWFKCRRGCEKALQGGYVIAVKPNENLSKHVTLI